RQAPAESLPFGDASFDAVVSTLVLCTVDDVQRSLAEIRRVLRPAGRLVFIEHVRADGFSGSVQDAIRPAWGYFAAGCNPNRRTGQALADAAFRVTSLQHTEFAPIIPVIYGTAEPT
ncbi:MAG: class I SAM-dependent methyltransferase, partial [Dehalococcoidia bacterium]